MRHVRYPKSVRAGWALFIKRIKDGAWERVGWCFTSRLDAHAYQAKHHSTVDGYRLRGLRYDPKPLASGAYLGAEKEQPSASN